MCSTKYARTGIHYEERQKINPQQSLLHSSEPVNESFISSKTNTLYKIRIAFIYSMNSLI